MLAVLPFENLTGDPAQEYFSDGLTEEMISQIGSIDPRRLGVIARTSAMHYKHTGESLEQIGRELGVSYVLEGSVRRDEGRVRISAQLIQVKDQSHVWTRQYDRELRELLSLQSEIGQEIAGEIQLALGGQAKAAKSIRAAPAETSYEAYDLYLRGLYFWNRRAEGFDRAVDYFQQAIVKDPNYARAYAALANTYVLMGTWYAGPASELMPKARAAALKALELDDSLAEPHAALALVAERHDYDWNATEREFHRAVELDPGYATAHQWYGEYLSFQGRFEEAFAESERARQLDPVSLIIASDDAAIYYRARQYDRAIAKGRAIINMDPSFDHPYGYVIVAYVRKGQFAEALDLVNRYLRPRWPPFAGFQETVIYGGWGRKADAERAFRVFAPCNSTDQDCDQDLLNAYLAMGRKDDAIVLLQKFYAERSPIITTLKIDPVFDPLRDDPRFQDLLRRVHLDH
jgi:TolB-like protein/Flp pilus assembly protein TadD